jgi:hypothetical protein
MRALDRFQYQLFRFHYILGADVALCCRRFHLTRDAFVDAIDRIKVIVGQAFMETEPFGLYPVERYFASSRERVQAFEGPKPVKNVLRPPLLPGA